MDKVNYGIMLNKFNDVISSFGDTDNDAIIELLVELKSDFIDLYGDSIDLD
jgi:hypothetical protein